MEPVLSRMIDPVHMLRSEGRTHPSYFIYRLSNVDPWLRHSHLVTSLEWYKQRGELGHEFLVAHINHLPNSLVFERAPHWILHTHTEKFSWTSERFPSSCNGVAKDDAIEVVRNINYFVRKRSAYLLARYHLHGLGILEFIRLANNVSEQSAEYRIDGSVCHWLAATIMAIAKSQFHGSGSARRRISWMGWRRGFTIHTDDGKQIESITEKYNEMRNADPVPLGPAQRANAQLRVLQSYREALRLFSDYREPCSDFEVV